MPTVLSYELADRLLTYDSNTGKLFWKPRTADMFFSGTRHGGPEAAAKTWNKRFAGKEAFASINNHGHRLGAIYRRRYSAHRVAWLLHFGALPSQDIDHINGDPGDNRIVNLRDVSAVENLRNQKKNSRNTSGVCGVTWDKRTGKWQAQIVIRQQNVFLGRFDDLVSAADARQRANVAYGFSPRHGRSVP